MGRHKRKKNYKLSFDTKSGYSYSWGTTNHKEMLDFKYKFTYGLTSPSSNFKKGDVGRVSTWNSKTKRYNVLYRFGWRTKQKKVKNSFFW